MKRIAFIAFGHTGSTFPLAQKLSERGYLVDYYVVNSCLDNIEGADFAPHKYGYGISKVDRCYWLTLSEFFNENVTLYLIKIFRPFQSVPIVRDICKKIRYMQINNICNNINAKSYDFINIVGRYDVGDIISFSKKLKGPVYISLHEVCNHIHPDFSSPTMLLQYLFSEKKNIIVHSDNSKNDILKYCDADIKCIKNINFGLFSSYSCIKSNDNISLPDKYALLFGRFTPYKGLDILYEAVNLLPIECRPYKFVIAGSGNSEILDKMENDGRFVIINKYLTNSDLVTLIEKSQFVLCPYKSVSQSGIPQTVYVFDKPIIASDLSAFKNIVINEKLGLLFPANESRVLAEKINMLIGNTKLYHSIVDNIKSIEANLPDYSWNKITDEYIHLMA